MAIFGCEKWSILVKILLSYIPTSEPIGFVALDSASTGFVVDKVSGSLTCKECGLQLKDVSPSLNLHALHLAHGHACCEFLKRYYDRSLVTHFQYPGQLTPQDPAPVEGALSEHVTTTFTHAAEDDEITPEASANQVEVRRRYHHYLHLREEKCKNHLPVQFQSIHSKDDPHSEKIRISTFSQVTLPNHMNSKLLAAIGFSLSVYGEIVCTFCKFHMMLIEDDSTECQIISSHIKGSPGCPFVNGSDCGNVPDVVSEACWSVTLDPPAERQTDVLDDVSGLGISYQLSKYSEMAVLSRRQSTFLTYPHVSPQPDLDKMCDAGYFYQGKDDSITCFSCGVESGDWSALEDPWKRHARSSCSCRFLIIQKGEEYVRSVLEEMGAYVKPREEMRINSVTVRMLRPRWDSPAVQRALDLGLDREAVKTAVCNRIKKGGPDFTTAAEIVRAVNELKVPNSVLTAEPEITLPTVVREPSSSYTHQTESERTDSVTDSDVVMYDESLAAANTQEQTERGEAMQTEERQLASAANIAVSETDDSAETIKLARELSSQLTCSICLSDVVGIVFLPCAHLVCCINCAAAMLSCPICRREIRATIRVFIGGASQSSTQDLITSERGKKKRRHRQTQAR